MPEISKIERRNILYDIKDETARELIRQKYSKPSNGIPLNDLSSEIRVILNQIPATAQSLDRLAIVARTGNYRDLINLPHIPSNISELTNDIGYLTDYTETDPVFCDSIASEITSNDVVNWNSKTDNIGTITSIKMNGTILGTSGNIDLGSVLTEHQDITGKQDVLVSGTNIKSVNGQSVLGSGDIDTLDAAVDEDTETLILS